MDTVDTLDTTASLLLLVRDVGLEVGSDLRGRFLQGSTCVGSPPSRWYLQAVQAAAPTSNLHGCKKTGE